MEENGINRERIREPVYELLPEIGGDPEFAVAGRFSGTSPRTRAELLNCPKP